MFNGIEEQDWKKLRKLEKVVLNRLCERILGKVRKQIDKDQNPHDSYLALFKLIQKQDKIIARTFNGLRRSNAVEKIINMAQEGLLTEEEFAQFSSTTKAQVQMFDGIKFYKKNTP